MQYCADGITGAFPNDAARRRPAFRRRAVLLGCAIAAATAVAAPVTEDEAHAAASAFASSDPVGSAVLRGRTVAGARSRDGLWIVSLAPQGHVILNGSDRADPIVGFSQSDFAEPDPSSPAFAMLAASAAASRSAEASGGARHAKWNNLLNGGNRRMLRASPVESPETVVIPPFLESHWNQSQPYNDYAPVYNASTNVTSYRGRCPCGCVATASAQILRHFRWPARLDRVDSFGHIFTDTNNLEKSFPIRFDGHAPIAWDDLRDDYDSYNYKTHNYDLRGHVEESVRHPIARLILWADAMSNMDFGYNGSSANYGTVAGNLSESYLPGKWVVLSEEPDIVKQDLLAGIPCHVSIGAYNSSGKHYKGHEVIVHGWAENGTTRYAYINFGWGGGNDGYYNIADDFQDYQEKKVYVGHYPRAKPQLDPLPKVCETNLTLNWHFPDLYTNSLSGFEVSIWKTGTQTSTFNDDFSATSGISDAENGSINAGVCDRLYVGTDSTYGSGRGSLLYAEPMAIGCFTYADKLTLTDSSVLSFRLRSVNANACIFEIQARFNDGEWTTVYAPPLSISSSGYTVDSEWKSYQVDMSAHAGETALFRIKKDYEWESYYSNGRILLDDFSVSNVLTAEAPMKFPVDADRRSCEVAGLEVGRTYSFAVNPMLDATALAAGETSEAVYSKIGADNVLGVPEILSVSPVEEGFYGEWGTNTTTFSVVCSETVETLEARPSHLALVRDEDVSVSKVGNGEFKVCVTPSGINESNFRSRMILTLAATDSNGTTAYKDLSLRFAPVESAPAVTVTAQSDSGSELSAVIPYTWFVENNLAASGDAAEVFERAARSDSDGDGFANWFEYVCQTDPNDADERLHCFIEVVNGEGRVTYAPASLRDGYRPVVKGTDDLRATEWTTVTTGTSPLHFFKVVVEPVP